MNKDYLSGIIDATMTLNTEAGIESRTIEFGLTTNRLSATWEAGTKLLAEATYWQPKEVETVFNIEYITVTLETPITQIIEFVTECTEQAMKDEINL